MPRSPLGPRPGGAPGGPDGPDRREGFRAGVGPGPTEGGSFLPGTAGEAPGRPARGRRAPGEGRGSDGQGVLWLKASAIGFGRRLAYARVTDVARSRPLGEQGGHR